MKTIILMVVSAALASVGCVLLLSLNDDHRALVFRVEQLAKVSEINAENSTRLLTELSQLRDYVVSNSKNAPLGKRSEEFIDSEKFAERILALEAAFSKIQSTASPESDKPEKGITEIYSQTKNHYAGSGQNPHVIFAEDEFQKDAGRPLGEFTVSLAETLHAMPALQVSEMDCKNTICKITYSEEQPADPYESDDEQLDIVDRLTQTVDGYAVEIRYANDSFGNDLMYVQLK